MSESTKMTQTQKRILTIGLVPLFMSLLSVSSINVVLPSIASDIDASTSALQWVLTGYALSFGVVLVAAGRAGDVFGRGQLFVIGVGLFGLSSLVAGIALTRHAQYLPCDHGPGLDFSTRRWSVCFSSTSEAARGRAFGLMGTTVGLSVAIGPVLGGALIALFGSDLGWRATFLVNVPFAIASVILARMWLPSGAWRPAVVQEGKSADGGKDLDPVGVILLGVGVLLILLPFVESSLGWFIWLSLPLGVGAIWLWMWWERHYARLGRPPMVDLDLFRIRSFSNGSIIIALYFLGVTSVWVLVAMYMQQGLGHTALAAGMIGLPAALCSAVSADVSGRFVFQIGRRLVVWGIALCLFGLVATIVVVALLSQGIGSEWWMLVTLAFIGTAQGMVISPNQTLTLQEVPLRYAGSSGGVLQTGQRIGTSMGLAIMTALAFSITAVSNWHWGMMGAFVAIAVVVILAGIVGLIEVRRGGPRRA